MITVAGFFCVLPWAGVSWCSVAIHPTGLSVAIGSKENLSIYNVLIQSLSEQKSLGAKQIRAVRVAALLLWRVVVPRVVGAVP